MVQKTSGVDICALIVLESGFLFLRRTVELASTTHANESDLYLISCLTRVGQARSDSAIAVGRHSPPGTRKATWSSCNSSAERQLRADLTHHLLGTSRYPWVRFEVRSIQSWCNRSSQPAQGKLREYSRSDCFTHACIKMHGSPLPLCCNNLQPHAW